MRSGVITVREVASSSEAAEKSTFTCGLYLSGPVSGMTDETAARLVAAQAAPLAG